MQYLDFINQLMSHPLAILMVIFIFFMVAIKRLNINFPEFVVAVNSINSQPFALMVLIIGFWMLVECKKFGIDTTIAGGVIGVASNMLQAQIKDATHPGPGTAVKSTTTIETSSPAPTVDVAKAIQQETAKQPGRVYNQIPK
jgi:hypothetical protein